MSGTRRGMWMAALVLCGAGLMQAQDPGGAPAPAQQQGSATPSQSEGPGHGPGPGPGRPGPERMQRRQLEMLTRQLQLTPAQVDQVKTIQADTMQQMMALRDDSSVAQPDRRTKMMAIRQGSQGKIRGLLTDEQKTKFDAMQTRMQERRDGHGMGSPNGPPAGSGGEGAPPPPPVPPAAD